MKKKIVCVIGTRPEAIKMAPVVQALKESIWANVTVLATAQHREMLDQVLNCFSIRPDIDFNLMKANQSLSTLTAQLLEKSSLLFSQLKPDAVVVHGDTTTALACAVAAFYAGTRIAHVEAGLRTGNIQSPFPEEFNRISIGRIANWHYCPTEKARQNLTHEGVATRDILVTGNTVIDALLTVAQQFQSPAGFNHVSPKEILVTCHRRENIGAPLMNICDALKRIAIAFPQHRLIYPVHPNPNVRDIVQGHLSGISNIALIEPLGYAQFIQAMQRCHFLITDSGGIQEEAPALSKPVLVLRQETERPEALSLGVVRLVGTDANVIYEAAHQLLTDEAVYQSMITGYSPYGDGKAAHRIEAHLRSALAE